MGDKKNKQKELVGISFNRSVPRQKRVYDFLVQEKLEKGTTYSAIVHEALYVYSKYLQHIEASPIFDGSFITGAAASAQTAPVQTAPVAVPVQTPATTASVEKAENEIPEEDVLLTDADMEDDYLQSILMETYADE